MILLCNKPNIKTVKNHNARKGEYLSQHFSRATHEKGCNNNKCCRRHLFVDVLKNKKKKLSLKSHFTMQSFDPILFDYCY